jgi:hypothetical protein
MIGEHRKINNSDPRRNISKEHDGRTKVIGTDPDDKGIIYYKSFSVLNKLKEISEKVNTGSQHQNASEKKEVKSGQAEGLTPTGKNKCKHGFVLPDKYSKIAA